MKSIKLLFFLLMPQLTWAQNAVKYINPFIGTDGTGHTFPGPSMPFGMVQPGPDTQDFGWNHTSGYQFKDTTILGFSQTRLSGTGINEMGDILLLPINPQKAEWKNTYSKTSECARVGYYSVTKQDNVKVELSCTNHVAFHQYTFPNKEAQVLVDFQHGLRFVFEANDPHGLVLESEIYFENDSTISGYCSTSNWVKRKYFYTMTFSQPFTSKSLLAQKANAKAPKYLFNFKLNKSKILKVKIALSTVGVEGAKFNMLSELNHWDFPKVYRDNRNTWASFIDRIQINAPRKQKEIFYTSLYHLLLQPSNIADVDGRYRGADDQIQTAPNKSYYSTLSNWDIYRGAFPLLQIIAPERINDIIQSLLLHYQSAGFLPIWTVWGQDNYCMIGNHAISMILSAYENGFRGFDTTLALKAMVETSTINHINSDWVTYNQYGYYPFDKLDNEAVSRTLESGYDDWCVSQMAIKLGKVDLSSTFQKRAQYYQNLYDSVSTFFRGKDSYGNWRSNFDPLIATSPLNNPGDYTEANAWQYFWTPAQHDLDGVVKLLGGAVQFEQKLQEFFNVQALHPDKFLGQEAMIGQYAHGNEPSHHVIYLYAFTNQSMQGQKYLHQVIQDFHNNTPDGMIGNDDCGQMSAWYILSTMGFYPVNPANGTFVFGAPQVKKITLKVPSYPSFKIKAANFSKENILQNEVLLNGQKRTHHYLNYSEIMKGGTLQFHMVPLNNKLND
jgi:predicted alpha-1,2-mannosidase